MKMAPELGQATHRKNCESGKIANTCAFRAPHAHNPHNPEQPTLHTYVLLTLSINHTQIEATGRGYLEQVLHAWCKTWLWLKISAPWWY